MNIRSLIRFSMIFLASYAWGQEGTRFYPEVVSNTFSPSVVAQSIAANSPNTDSDETELSSVEQLKKLFGTNLDTPEYLRVEEAFQLQVVVINDSNLEARFSVADGYYLYKDKIKFESGDTTQIISVSLPQGVTKEDAYFGKMEVYKYDFNIPVIFQQTDEQAKQITITVNYQGCAEQGICYNPVSQTFELTLPNGNVNVNHESPWLLFVGAFLAGLLLSLTPCVLPMIPILLSIITGQNIKQTSVKNTWVTIKSTLLAIAYVLGATVTYAAIGAIAGATGEHLQSYFQNAWAIGIMALIFVLMALSMFGLFSIQMPSFIQSILQQKSLGIGGSLPMVFVLGMISALVIGACVSPVLISFLSIAMKQGDPILGAKIMAMMSLGMGVSLILLGVGAGLLLPKAGPWMEKIKHFFGLLLLAEAIYLLGILPQVPILYLWAAFLLSLGIYLNTRQLPSDSIKIWQIISKVLGIVFMLWGIVALIGGYYGERDILSPLPQLNQNTQTTLNGDSDSSPLTRINNITELDQKMEQAKSEGKPVLLDFYADWCIDCIRMEKTTLSDLRVQTVLKQKFIALQVDITDPKDKQRTAIKKRFNVFGPPAVLFFNPNGQQLAESFYGYMSPDDFLKLITEL